MPHGTQCRSGADREARRGAHHPVQAQKLAGWIQPSPPTSTTLTSSPMGPIREPGSSACLHARHQRLHPCDDGSGGGRQTAPEPDSTPQESLSAVVLAELRFGIKAAAAERRQRQSAGTECFSGHGGSARLAWRSCRSLRAAARRTQGPVNSGRRQRSADRLPCPPAGEGVGDAEPAGARAPGGPAGGELGGLNL